MNFKNIKDFNLKEIDFGAYFAIISALIIAVLAFAYTPSRTGTFLIKVNNKEIGYINDLDKFESVINNITTTDGNGFVNHIKTKKMACSVKKYLTYDEAECAIRNDLGLKLKAWSIYINGKEIAKVKAKQDIKDVLDVVKKYYIPKYGSFKIVSCSIKEKITSKAVYLDKDIKFASNKSIAVKILKGQDSNKIYRAKSGDTIWTIALKNDVSIDEIEAANRGMNINKIKINQPIKLNDIKPYLNVKLVVAGSAKEQISYSSKTIPNKYLLKGITKVRVPGKLGLAQVEKKLVIQNGYVINEDVIKSKVIRKPKIEILYVGIKQSLLLASGIFIRPSRGCITSTFGRRWGRMHEGVDIASPTGTPIVAADNGTVEFAGWKNGYGNCVMIKHGSGCETLYGHTSRYIVKEGQNVRKGQLIAYVGSTGRSTGPHLHFQVMKNGEPVNPLKYIH